MYCRTVDLKWHYSLIYMPLAVTMSERWVTCLKRQTSFSMQSCSRDGCWATKQSIRYVSFIWARGIGVWGPWTNSPVWCISCHVDLSQLEVTIGSQTGKSSSQKGCPEPNSILRSSRLVWSKVPGIDDEKLWQRKTWRCNINWVARGSRRPIPWYFKGA